MASRVRSELCVLVKSMLQNTRTTAFCGPPRMGCTHHETGSAPVGTTWDLKLYKVFHDFWCFQGNLHVSKNACRTPFRIQSCFKSNHFGQRSARPMQFFLCGVWILYNDSAWHADHDLWKGYWKLQDYYWFLLNRMHENQKQTHANTNWTVYQTLQVGKRMKMV